MSPDLSPCVDAAIHPVLSGRGWSSRLLRHMVPKAFGASRERATDALSKI